MHIYMHIYAYIYAYMHIYMGASFLTQSLTIPYQNEIVVHFRVLNIEVRVNGNHVNKQR